MLKKIFSKKKVFTLAEGTSYSAVSDSNRKIAFTLAEVLITLGIIGVVAALTVPTLVSKYKEKATVTKLKKVNSVLSQAMTSVINEYGTIDTWNLAKSSEVIDKEEGSGAPISAIIDDTGMRLMLLRFGKYLKHEKLDPTWGDNIPVTNMQGVEITNQNWPAAMKLEDGTILMVGGIVAPSKCQKGSITEGGYCSSIVVWFPDRSGKRIEGINQFDFFVMKNRILPWGLPDDSSNPFDTNCDITNNYRRSGRGCTAWVLYNENMDYLHCNDLSWNGKKKCR